MLRDDDPEQGTLAAELADAFCTRPGYESTSCSTAFGATLMAPTVDSLSA